MRQRSISSISVVLFGVLAALVGGPVFAVFTALVFLLAYHEFYAMSRRLRGGEAPAGFVVVPLAAILGWLAPGAQSTGLVAVAAVGLPLIRALFVPVLAGRAAEWAFASAGTIYLALPAYAFTSLRGTDGAEAAGWLSSIADGLAFGWDAAPRGLAWVLFALVIAWLSDTVAYLVGRSIGRRALIPRISPRKTVEGAIGGVVGGAITGAISVAVFGLGISVPVGGLLGLGLSGIGILGDLGESLLKREAGVKDSGTLIPGHGGVLDRVDALVFIIFAVWLLEPVL